ncbi:MAG: response regulator [Candidatus Thermoplasmatota archaeon]
MYIVYDDEGQLYSIKTGFRLKYSDQYKIIPLGSGEKFLELLKEDEKPDLVLLDIMMPGLSGWEVFDKIKDTKKWQDIPIVFLTARSDKFARKPGNWYCRWLFNITR